MTLLLLLLPIWVALAWVGLFGIVSWRSNARIGEIFGRWGGYVQLGILLGILLVVRFTTSIPAESPELESYRWSVPVAVALAALSGPTLYLGELLLAVGLEGRTSKNDKLSTIVDGGSKSLVEVSRGMTAVALLVIVLPIVEEILWRRYLVVLLIDDWGLTAAVAVLLAGLSFGLNHYWFGVRNIITKTVVGSVWGWLFLIGGLPAAIVAHISFQACVMRRLNYVAAQTASSADPGRPPIESA